MPLPSSAISRSPRYHAPGALTRFVKFIVRPRLVLQDPERESLARTVLEKAKRSCLVTNGPAEQAGGPRACDQRQDGADAPPARDGKDRHRQRRGTGAPDAARRSSRAGLRAFRKRLGGDAQAIARKQPAAPSPQRSPPQSAYPPQPAASPAASGVTKASYRRGSLWQIYLSRSLQ